MSCVFVIWRFSFSCPRRRESFSYQLKSEATSDSKKVRVPETLSVTVCLFVLQASVAGWIIWDVCYHSQKQEVFSRLISTEPFVLRTTRALSSQDSLCQVPTSLTVVTVASITRRACVNQAQGRQELQKPDSAASCSVWGHHLKASWPNAQVWEFCISNCLCIRMKREHNKDCLVCVRD